MLPAPLLSAQSETVDQAYGDPRVAEHARVDAHGKDWLDKAANKAKLELPSIQRMKQWFISKVLLHACAVCVFFAQYVAVKLRHRENTSCELCPLALVCVYFCIGVLMPCWSEVVGHSAPVMCILTHREHYKKLKDGGSVRLLMSWSQWLCPVSNVLALVAPCYVCFGLANTLSSDQQVVDILSACDERLKLWLFGSSFSGLVGMLVFTSGKSGEIVVDASVIAIKGFISEMKRSPADWDPIAWHHWLLDKALADVWALDCVGGLWLMRIVVLFAGGLGLGAYSLGQKDTPLRHLMVVGWLLLGLSGIALLAQLAMITTLCQNKRAGADSVIAVAHEFILRPPQVAEPTKRSSTSFVCSNCGFQVCHLSRYEEPVHANPTEPSGERNPRVSTSSYASVSTVATSSSDESRIPKKTLEQNYLAYLTGSNMGVQMLGVAITYSFVFTIVCQMLVYMPIGLNIVGHLVHPSHETDLASTSPGMSATLGPLLL